MTKIELTEKILDAITDPWNECPLDYEDLTPLNLEEATGYLAELRRDEDLSDLDADERVPDEVTPELYMEVFNCHLRAMKHECRALRLAKYLTDNECVCEYDQFRHEYEHHDPIVLPVDFLWDMDVDSFPFSSSNEKKYYMFDMLKIGLNSANTFKPSDMFCWYDEKENTLHSTNAPYHDGIIDARAFAEFILGPDGQDAVEYFIDDVIDSDGNILDDELAKIFTLDEDENN